jgi:hypothetical protein
MDRSRIDETLSQIDRGYQAGCLVWVKWKRPNEWRKMIVLETEINRLAFQGNDFGLIKVLKEYEDFVIEMVRTFKAPDLFSRVQG